LTKPHAPCPFAVQLPDVGVQLLKLAVHEKVVPEGPDEGEQLQLKVGAGVVVPEVAVPVVDVPEVATGFTVTTSVSLGPELEVTPTVKFVGDATEGAG
jgi:hypothetical protein